MAQEPAPAPYPDDRGTPSFFDQPTNPIPPVTRTDVPGPDSLPDAPATIRRPDEGA
jgi:hypothetical protein